MMGRFRGMVRGFCTAAASIGYGIGSVAVSMRFTPNKGTASRLIEGLGREVFPAMLSRRGIASLHLFRPAPPPPMTKEQSIRGPDTPMTWSILARNNFV